MSPVKKRIYNKRPPSSELHKYFVLVRKKRPNMRYPATKFDLSLDRARDQLLMISMSGTICRYEITCGKRKRAESLLRSHQCSRTPRDSKSNTERGTKKRFKDVNLHLDMHPDNVIPWIVEPSEQGPDLLHWPVEEPHGIC